MNITIGFSVVDFPLAGHIPKETTDYFPKVSVNSVFVTTTLDRETLGESTVEKCLNEEATVWESDTILCTF